MLMAVQSVVEDRNSCSATWIDLPAVPHVYTSCGLCRVRNWTRMWASEM